MDQLEDLRHLRALNDLIALVTRSEPALVDEVKASINFTMENAQPGGPSPVSLGESAQNLLEFYAQHHETSYGFFHCELRDEEYDPLWVRERIREGLRQLAGYDEAIMLITGLRRMICPPGKRWTERRRQQYDRAVSFIEDTGAELSTTHCRLNMLFL